MHMILFLKIQAFVPEFFAKNHLNEKILIKLYGKSTL